MNALICFVVPVLFVVSYSFRYEDMLDADDILRADLMPSSLLMVEGPVSRTPWNNVTRENFKRRPLSFNGSWDDAYTTMGFHRKMLNEYLCRNFVADEIISQMQRPLLAHRVGKPFTKSQERNKPSIPSDLRKSLVDLSDVKENLLSDPGSSSYRDWLSKTATLEDVYRHYGKEAGSRSDAEVEYDGGEITGYAMPGPQRPMPVATHEYQTPLVEQYVPFIHQGFVQQPEQQDAEKLGGGDYEYSPHHVHFHTTEEEKEPAHGMAMHDMFDIALSALAFLSFGMFILQVIMCISMNKPTAMMQMVDNPGEAETFDEIRFRRDAASPNPHGAINELARRVLTSIEAGTAAARDDGACLRRTMCDDNRYSRTLEGNQKIWIPVWGLGMSWLSSRFLIGSPSTSIMLDSLRACALGLAKADCETLYGDCDMRQLLSSSKTNRMKRATPNAERKGEKG